MGFPEITQALNRETEAWNAHDADGVAACYAEDAVLYDVGLPDTVQGRAAIRDSVAGYLPPFRIFTSTCVSRSSMATGWPRSSRSPGPMTAS